MKKYLLSWLLLLSSLAYSQSKESVYVYFDFDKYVLSRSTLMVLDSLTDSLDLADRIELHGHCDAKGSDEYNIRLSRKRVRAVEKYLLDIGWEKKDIGIVEAHGERIPLDENDSESGRKINRRVEIKILRGQAVQSTLKEKLENKTLKAGDNIVLNNIHFFGGMHRLMPESAPTLKELLDAMRSHPNLVIRIEGHICCQQERGKAIMDYLVANGIEAKRISYKGFGHSAPLYPFPEKNEEEQKLNRRVEIKIISK